MNNTKIQPRLIQNKDTALLLPLAVIASIILVGGWSLLLAATWTATIQHRTGCVEMRPSGGDGGSSDGGLTQSLIKVMSAPYGTVEHSSGKRR